MYPYKITKNKKQDNNKLNINKKSQMELNIFQEDTNSIITLEYCLHISKIYLYEYVALSNRTIPAFLHGPEPWLNLVCTIPYLAEHHLSLLHEPKHPNCLQLELHPVSCGTFQYLYKWNKNKLLNMLSYILNFQTNKKFYLSQHFWFVYCDL